MDLQPIFDAISAHRWALVFALVVGALVALMKQGWLGTYVANKLPPAARPWLAVGLGVASLMVADLQAGKSWQQAVFDGISAAMVAIFGHDFIVEGLRKGKEIIPTAPYAKPPSGDAPGNGPYRTKSDPVPPPAPPATPFLEGLRLARRTVLSAFAFRLAVLCFFISIAAPFVQACKGPVTANEVEQGVLSAAQIACIEVSQYSNVQDLVKACQIEQDLSPLIVDVINQLVGQREAAKKMGFHWVAPNAGAVESPDAAK